MVVYLDDEEEENNEFRDAQPPYTLLNEILGSLTRYVSAESLEHLCLIITPESLSRAEADWEVFVGSLEMLTGLKHAEIFLLNEFGPLADSNRLGISRRQLTRLLQRWPLLQYLGLRLRDSLTLHDLLDTLPLMPHVKTLDVNVSVFLKDVTTLNWDESITFPANSQTYVCLLWDSRMEHKKRVPGSEAASVARLLWKIAPSLQNIGLYDAYEEPYSKERLMQLPNPSWTEVIDEVHRLQEDRAASAG